MMGKGFIVYQSDIEADAAMHKIWAEWINNNHFRSSGVYLDQGAFYEIAQPIIRKLAMGKTMSGRKVLTSEQITTAMAFAAIRAPCSNDDDGVRKRKSWQDAVRVTSLAFSKFDPEGFDAEGFWNIAAGNALCRLPDGHRA
jgi:hypothetical protein